MTVWYYLASVADSSFVTDNFNCGPRISDRIYKRRTRRARTITEKKINPDMKPSTSALTTALYLYNELIIYFLGNCKITNWNTYQREL